MGNHLDELLGSLRARAPFPVDWGAYSRELFARLAKAEARRRRRLWWVGLSGALVGAAATVAVVFAWWAGGGVPGPDMARPGAAARAPSEQSPAAVLAPHEESASWIVRGTANGVTVARLTRAAGTLADELPRTGAFGRQFRRKDGGLAEIRFLGEGSAGHGTGSGIFAARRLK